MEYIRLELDTPDGKRKVWAEAGKPRGRIVTYRVVDKEGAWTGEIIVAMPNEGVKKPATMNLHYGELEMSKMRKRDKTIVLSPSQYNVTPGKFRPSVFRRFGIGLGIGAMLGGYAGYKLGRKKGKKVKKSADTIVLTDIHKTGFFCPYCSATLMLKNPMDDAVHCKCGKNFNIIIKYVMHPNDKHLGMKLDTFDDYESIDKIAVVTPGMFRHIKNLYVNRIEPRLPKRFQRKKEEEAKEVTKGAGSAIVPLINIGDDVAYWSYRGAKRKKEKRRQAQMQHQRTGG